MTDVQRWQASINYLYPVNDETPMHSGRMEVILYADHVKAVKAAEQRVESQQLDPDVVFSNGHKIGYDTGFAAGVTAARDAVEALKADMANWSSTETWEATDAAPDLTVDQWLWAQRGVERAKRAIDAVMKP